MNAGPLLVVVGGRTDPSLGEAARAGRRARNDITEFGARLGAETVDFAWLADAGRSGRLSRPLAWVANKTGRWSELLAVRVFVRARRYRTIYATGEDIGVVLAALTRVAFWRRQRIVVRIENLHYGRSPLRRWAYTRALSFAAKRMDAVICRSEMHANELRRIGTRDASRVIAFPQETDTAFFRPDAPSIDGAQAAVPPRPYLFSAGLELRDYDTLLAAVRDLPVHVVIAAGSPWSKDTFDVQALPSNVEVSRFSPPQMRELYRASTAVVLAVHPTDRNCGMNVVAEAWAMGRPVIAATTGLATIIGDAGGIVVSPGDVDGLRDAIAALLEDPGSAATMGRQGREYAETHLSLDRFVDAVADLTTGHPPTR